jgi:hypothetical protein
VRTLLERAAPVAREVLIAGLRRFAVHPRQQVDGGKLTYLELCPAYLRACVECCYETARRAWRDLRGALGWWSVSAGTAEAMGAELRPLRSGQRHGQHLLVDPGLTPALRELAQEMGVLHTTPDAELSWETVRPLRRGAGWVARCPFHEDDRPSMLLDHRRRRGTCLACGTVHRFDGERVSAPIDRGVRPPLESLASPSSTTGCPEGPSPWVVGLLGVRGLVTGLSSEEDLLGVLVEAESRARTSVASPMAGLRDRPRESFPDLVAHLDPVVPTGWESSRGRWRPAGHRATAERWILVDVDEIEVPNVLDAWDGEELRAAGQEIEAWARSVPGLSGRVGLVQTSLHGVQVVLELDADRPPGWRRGCGISLVDQAGSRVLEALDRHGYLGGYADPSARLGGRLLRRPGPRIDKRGQPWVARLRYHTEEPPCPRS